MKNQNNEKVVEKKLVDPMVFDSEEDLAKKNEIWKDIFLRCPDAADSLIDLYNKIGAELFDKAMKHMIAKIAEMTDKESADNEEVLEKINKVLFGGVIK